jgi:hypothetical protein
MGEMVQVCSDEWYCPSHALLLAARDLVALYRVEGDADWTAISEIIAETLPDLVAKMEARKERRVVGWYTPRRASRIASGPSAAF